MTHVNSGGVHSSTPLLRRNGCFEELPSPNDAANRAFYFVRYIYTGDYSGNYSPGFSFVMHNLQLKYGKEWFRKAGELAPRRLKHWGFNTIANWSDPQVCAANRLPYTVGVALAGSGARVIGGGAWKVGSVWDVYDPKFPQYVDDCVRGAGKIAGSPWCIGIFVDNELHWGSDLAAIAFASGPEQPAKQALVGLLRRRYRDDIAALNRSWGSAFADWQQLAGARKRPDPARTAADFDAFYTQTAETYFRTVRDSIRRQCGKDALLITAVEGLHEGARQREAPDGFGIGEVELWQDSGGAPLAQLACRDLVVEGEVVGSHDILVGQLPRLVVVEELDAVQGVGLAEDRNQDAEDDVEEEEETEDESDLLR